MIKVGVLGSGQVGQVLANGFLTHGFAVMRGSRDPSKLADWAAAAGEHAQTGTFAAAAAWAELVVLAVKGAAAEAAIELAGVDNLTGKIVIDTTNPIVDAPPSGSVIKYFTSLEHSLMERLQTVAPRARFVKAFSSVGNAMMVNPALPGGPPTMFICGDDDVAKADVTKILEKFGWETEDCGGVSAARAIEPLCILWCIPGFLNHGWSHAFKLLRPAP